MMHVGLHRRRHVLSAGSLPRCWHIECGTVSVQPGTRSDAWHLKATLLLQSIVAALTPAAVLLQVEHLDDHRVELRADGVTRPGEVTVIKGEGMPVFESVRSRASSTHMQPPRSLCENIHEKDSS